MEEKRSHRYNKQLFIGIPRTPEARSNHIQVTY